MTGLVRMFRDDNAAMQPWKIILPDGSPLDVTGTKTKGVNEALAWAHEFGFSFRLDAGGIAATGVNHMTIPCAETVIVPPFNVGSIDFGAVTFHLRPDNPSDFGVVIDTQDMLSVRHSGQIVYFGTGTAVYECPTTTNGELNGTFIGSCHNDIVLGDIVIADPNTYAPVSTHGVGYRFSCANGTVSNVYRKFRVNGGIVSVQVDTPPEGHYFKHNTVMADCLNYGYAGLVDGLAETAGIYGNLWTVHLSGAQRGIVTQATENSYAGSIEGPEIGVYENSGAARNTYNMPSVRCNTPHILSATSKWL